MKETLEDHMYLLYLVGLIVFVVGFCILVPPGIAYFIYLVSAVLFPLMLFITNSDQIFALGFFLMFSCCTNIVSNP